MRRKTALMAVGAALLTTAAFAPSALAAGQDGRCEPGEFCLYFNSGQEGSMVDMSNGHKDYGAGANCIEFITAGAGRGRCVKNNAASGWNREDFAVTVFYKSGWSGAIDTFVSGERANLTKTKNENASHVVGEAGNERLANQLYQSGGGRITAYFDGYLNTSGRHEGIDIAKGVGEPVHALIGGTCDQRARRIRARRRRAVADRHLQRRPRQDHRVPAHESAQPPGGRECQPRSGDRLTRAIAARAARRTRTSRCAPAGRSVRPTARATTNLTNDVPTGVLDEPRLQHLLLTARDQSPSRGPALTGSPALRSA